MLHIAFFRNLNQGQRNSPTTGQLVDAFTESGATSVRAFQTNGTVIFDATDPTAALRAVVERVAGVSGWRDEAFVRPVDWLVRVLGELKPDQGIDERRLEVSVFRDTYSPVDAIPLAGRRCVVFAGDSGFAVTLNERPQESNATPTLGRLLGTPVTSRGVPTLRRLALSLSSSCC